MLERLQGYLSGSCRLLVLSGITGIGKTALAERLCLEHLRAAQSKSTYFVRKNFDHKLGSADFTEVTTTWLEDWGECPSAEMRQHPPYLLKKVLQILCNHPRLILLDSLEALLLGNEETGWSVFADPLWEEFFGNFLSAEKCQSCLIVTTQDIPASLVEIGGRYPNFWHWQPLLGLTAEEQKVLFANIGIPLSSLYETLIARIGQVYGGHPLALRTIAREVVQDFQGDLSVYWQHYGSEIEDVEIAQSEAAAGKVSSSTDAWALDRYSMALRWRVKGRLEQTFIRLAENAPRAYLLLCAASVYRCPVKQSWWLRHLEHRGLTKEEQQAALIALRERYLVEWVIEPGQGVLVGQHNLVRSVALQHREHLSEEVSNREIAP